MCNLRVLYFTTVRKRDRPSSFSRAEEMPCSKQPAVEHCVQQVAQTPRACSRLTEPVAQARNRQPAQVCTAQTVPNEDIDDDFMYTETLSLHTNQQELTALTKVCCTCSCSQ